MVEQQLPILLIPRALFVVFVCRHPINVARIVEPYDITFGTGNEIDEVEVLYFVALEVAVGGQ
jgi:hypothetical protein